MSEEKPGTINPKPSSSNYRNLQNVLGIGGRSRLPSIRTPRDLTLSTSTTKRVFVPNIPVRREKKTQSEAKKETPKILEIKKDSDRKPHATRTRVPREYVPLAGSAFSEGILPTGTKKGRNAASNVPSQTASPNCKVKKAPEGVQNKMKKEVKDDDDDLGDDFIDDGDEDHEKGEQSFPIIIPMNKPFPNSDAVSKFDIDGLFGNESAQMKQESKAFVKHGSKPFVKQESNIADDLKPRSLADILGGLTLNEESPISLFMFPTNADSPATTGEPSTNKEPVSQRKPSVLELPEGRIGKLQRLKSGKCRFIIDGVPFDFVTAIPNPLHQDLVAVEKEGQETILTELGQIQNVYNSVPSIEKILK